MTDKLKVLIVDDEKMVSDFMRMRLAVEAPHFEIAHVKSGLECLEYLKDGEADCILSDYQMPGMDGMELLKRLRAGGRETPFIFITGQGNQEVASEAFKEGASDYFTKDIGFAHFPRIVNSIERAVMNRREQESRERAEAALKEGERRLREMLENVKLIAVMLDSAGRVIFCNDFLLGLTGWSKEELLGRDWFDTCLPPDSREATKGYFLDFLESRLASSHENSIITKDGRERFIRWNNSVLKDEDGRVIGTTSIGEDVTEQKIAEKKLSESEQRYKDLVELSMDFIYRTNQEGKFTYINESAFKALEYGLDEILEKPCDNLIHPEDRERTVKTLQKMIDERVDFFSSENRLISKSGRVINVLHNVRVLRDEKGDVTGTQGIARDITTIKRAEDERSAMFHMLTHDIRSPLSVIYGYGSLASQLKGEEAEEAIADIQKAARKIYKMIDDILALSRIESKEGEFILSAASINDIVGQALKENEAVASEKEITVNVDIARCLPRVYCDTTQVERAVGNIISNAINYNRQGGVVDIHAGLMDAREFFIEISDNGRGIGEEDRPRIFDKYYRGRESRKKKGTGLGLAIVKAVVEAHSGRVEVRSAKGEGSTFTIILPVKPGL